ncbi:hypothetical protein GCM10012282_78230 [Streptomyces lacrimifluminis]|uniref:Uncharacterized protein n=1 Tax=Streptomyces lacrimifluminis TaxID=1500077 RepID=A0A917PBF7_9ACTN|nr:hypothetical protein GCM10012282_78230 [Streptomyces lacrimifluminis]
MSCCPSIRGSRPAPASTKAGLTTMEHWLSIIQAVGDLIHLINGLTTLAMAVTDLAGRRRSDRD